MSLVVQFFWNTV